MIQRIGTKTIETERLVLRAFQVSDTDAMFAWASDPAVANNMRYSAHQNREETRQLLQSWEESYATDPLFFNWAIVLKETGETIGSIGMVDVDEENRSVAVGYCMLPSYWGKGIMTEALKRVIRYGFEEIQFNRIFSYHFLTNPASGRVQQKAGMKYEGLLRQYVFVKGKFCNVKLNAIVRDDFEQNKAFYY